MKYALDEPLLYENVSQLQDPKLEYTKLCVILGDELKFKKTQLFACIQDTIRD